MADCLWSVDHRQLATSYRQWAISHEVIPNRRFLNSAYPAAHLLRQRILVRVDSRSSVVTDAAPGGGYAEFKKLVVLRRRRGVVEGPPLLSVVSVVALPR
jgi:hypothetical protein